MIAKSDLVILVLSASALAVGVYRWQSNTGNLAVNAPAVQVAAAPAPSVTPEPGATVPVAGSLEQPDSAIRPTVRRLDVDDGNQPDAPRVLGAPAPITEATLSVAPEENVEAGEPLYGVYRVRSGDYLGKIANEFGTSVATLRDINGIRGSTIQVGQEIRYPQPAN